ncbi:MAG: isoleucine--tRNA ligase [Candidatus Magasanikbacteria bacterium]|nr:isoleucine--tRNA ligase [Candidatus Magasanikbacteria bacterium]
MYDANKEELEVLDFWKKKNIFEKSVELRPEEKPYVFYDGPPFATGLPHYGHILSSVIKDLVPRYWTMKGYRVRRRWGWDCHGLPIEQMIEKELKISGKKNIEQELGVKSFNDACRSKVLLYTGEWKKMVDRIGRWVEFDNAYKTMDASYMESVWWALKNIWDKGLIYEGRKVLLYCPRCETPVSKAEIAMDNSYKDITEESVIVKFKLTNPESHKLPGNTFFLAWTTTPWTLPGNVGLTMGEKILYAVVKKDDAHYIVAHDLVQEIFKDDGVEIVSVLPGNSLKDIEYEPLFEIAGMAEMGKKSHYVMIGDFVNTDEGTGIVHTAVIYGEDDYTLGLRQDLPMLPLLDDSGHFNEAAPEFIRGQYFKTSEKEIKRNLENRGLLFNRQQYTHSYPHCWRCDTQLFYNAISAWFINIQKIKDRLVELNKDINWYPEHLKNGRFLDILETAPDWNISRNRYWATPLPFWKCEQSKEQENKEKSEVCGHLLCVGSFAELKKRARNFDEVFSSNNIEDVDLHKHEVDQIVLDCEKCGGLMRRVPEVVDCWVESGSMPFAEFHYPFENKEIFEKRFPGQYIAEYIAQTRAWFYYMHVMAVLLFDSLSFEHVVTTGTILNEKGEKLSKSKMNYTDPWLIIEQYGVDALRYYLMTSVVMQAENLFFNDKEVKDVYNKVINMLWNVLSFYEMFQDQNTDLGQDAKDKKQEATDNVYDAWILSELQILLREVTKHMDNYDTVKAGRPIKAFIDNLSTWYVRRSRDRFKGADGKDKQGALATLREVLLTLSKIMAPFTPFIAENIYRRIMLGNRTDRPEGREESVHLEQWPEPREELIDIALMEDMESLREAAALGHKIRKDTKLNTRQPLSECKVAMAYTGDRTFLPQFQEILADELNVKQVEIFLITDKASIDGIKKLQTPWLVADGQSAVLALNTELSEELKKEGLLREITRAINQMRKVQNLTIEDEIDVYYHSDEQILKDIFKDYETELKQLVLARSFLSGGSEELVIEGKKILLDIKKV